MFCSHVGLEILIKLRILQRLAIMWQKSNDNIEIVNFGDVMFSLDNYKQFQRLRIPEK